MSFCLERRAHSNRYYVSNALPLYAKCYADEDDVIPHRVYEYLQATISPIKICAKIIFQREGVLNFTKGIPTSLAMRSLQQWDKDNAWPPMVHMVVEGFRTTGDIKLMKVPGSSIFKRIKDNKVQVAQDMATQWLIVNYKSYSSTYAMFTPLFRKNV